MKKLSLIIMSLFFMTVANAQEWNFVNSFSASTGRQHGIAFDGEYIYTSSWSKSSTVLSMFYKYDLEGNLIEEFDVPGIGNGDNYSRDLTYDGTYFYGCDAHSGTIWCYDLHNKTLVTSNIIETSLDELGTCSYDPVNDAFWVGERATGSSPNLHLDLKLVNRSGAVIRTATAYNLGGHTVHGTGFFNDEDGVAHLYLFAVEGFTAHVFDYNIDEDTMNPNYIFDFASTPGWSVACSAGGAYIGEYEGSVYFFGDVDRSPNLIGIYALGDYTPIIPTPPEGDIFFDFNDGIMRWTTIDADGDGFTWEMRQNWSDPDNQFSVTSASYDNITETPLFPDNYLVTPYKLDCEQITFKACAQDDTRPAEHFGVAVSTTSNTDADEFTIIWDTDLTAKVAGEWHSFNVDLRDYQGQDIYIAIVHFNCTDQFMINIDDIMLYREYNDVDEIEMSLFTVYPNPTSEKLIIEGQVVVNQYDIYNVAGDMIMSKPVDEKSFEVNVSELPAGTYLIKMSANGLVQTKRFVKE